MFTIFFFQKKFKRWKKISNHKSEVRTVLLEVGIVVGIVLGISKKGYLKLAIRTLLTHSNSIARHFSPTFHAKSLLPRLDKSLPVRI